jgi:hypothetical protein
MIPVHAQEHKALGQEVVYSCREGGSLAPCSSMERSVLGWEEAMRTAVECRGGSGVHRQGGIKEDR